MDNATPRTNGSKIAQRNLLIPAIVIVLIIIVIAFFAVRKSSQTPLSASSNSSDKISIEKAKASQTLNKDYMFSLKDDSGKEVSKIKYNIGTIEKRDEIIVKGQKASLVDGRTFLVINLKITNNYDKALQINARDYIRLIIDNSSEKLAPDIHNDPVEVQPESTKETRVAFPIDDNKKSLTLQVGELTGKKDLIKLNLK